LQSCKKDPLDKIADDEAQITGKILEKGSKKPVKGAKVYLRNCKSGPLFTGYSCQAIDSVTTDNTGRYSFIYKFAGFSGRGFDLVVRVPEGFRQENSAVALAPNTHDIVNYDVEIIPRAWIKIHVKNINPFDDFDEVWISGGWSGGSHDHIYKGNKVDLFFSKDIIGNDSIGVGWSVTKNNLSNFTVKKMYAIAHDTMRFELLY
jgi:hypothetical protein